MNMCRLYHGSKGGLVGEITPSSRDCCDFGRGFYLGDSPAQPMALICHHERPRFYVCDLDLEGLSTYDFQSRYEWALYVAYCRGKCARFVGTPLYDRISRLGDGVDVLKGKIANDRMFMVLNDWHYLTGESSAQIYAQAPLEVMLDVFPGMHALSPEMAVEDLKRNLS